MNDPETAVTEELSDLDSIESSLAAGFGEETPTEPAPGKASAQPPAVSGEAPKPTVEAPKHWNEADRGLFAKAPPEIQQRWISREAEQQKGLDTKFQEIAGFRKEREQLDELFAPYTRDLELRGASRTQFISSLLGAHKFLLEKPLDALRWLAQEYGIDPKKLSEAAPQQDSAALAEIAKLRNEVGGFLTKQQQAEHSANLEKVQRFAEAKDEKGNLIHPYFEELSQTILQLMQAGVTKDLEVAYNKAVRADDKVWEKHQADVEKRKQTDAETKRKAEIDKAKRAGKTSVTSQSNGQSREVTLEEQLAAGFANYGT